MKPRILVVGPVPPPFGGFPRFVLDLLEGDLRQQVELIHFNTSFSGEIRPQQANPGHARYGPVRVRRMAKYGYLFSTGLWAGFRTIAAALSSAFRYALVVARRRPDVVHVFANMHWGYWRSGLLILIARVLRRRILFHPLGAIDQFYQDSGAVARAGISFVLNCADLVLVQSPGLSKVVAPMTRRPVHGLFNGIRLDPLLPLAERRRGHEGGIRFLAVGDLGHNKGTADILAAAARMATDYPDAIWIFVGRGDLDEWLGRAGAAGLSSRVTFTGAIDEQTKLTQLERADVFLLPSYGEGQPLSLLEAMAAGLPVISSTVGSIPEVVGSENGFLIQPGDVGALEARMRTLAASPELRTRMGRTNTAEARVRFDVRRLHGQLAGVYQGLCGDGHAKPR